LGLDNLMVMLKGIIEKKRHLDFKYNNFNTVKQNKNFYDAVEGVMRMMDICVVNIELERDD
jgi:hypothetical protein